MSYRGVRSVPQTNVRIAHSGATCIETVRIATIHHNWAQLVLRRRAVCSGCERVRSALRPKGWRG
jgi:hypothetical protein